MKIRAKIKSEFKSKTPVKVPSKSIISLLNSLYVTRKFSQVRIGKMLGVQGNTVRRWLDRCDIIETMKEAEVRYSESHKTVNILI
jgi:hypothetical protein